MLIASARYNQQKGQAGDHHARTEHVKRMASAVAQFEPDANQWNQCHGPGKLSDVHQAFPLEKAVRRPLGLSPEAGSQIRMRIISAASPVSAGRAVRSSGGSLTSTLLQKSRDDPSYGRASGDTETMPTTGGLRIPGESYHPAPHS